MIFPNDRPGATWKNIAKPNSLINAVDVASKPDRSLFMQSSASLMIDFRFDLTECVGTMLRGDHHEFLAIDVAALYFVKTAGRVSRPSDNRSPCENVVHERSGLGAVKQAGARLGF